jgi:hypothetical protein
MQQRQLRLGDILDDYCPRERRVTNHAVVAMVGEEVKQTRCTTCDAEHVYKQARVPRQRRKEEAPAALYAQVAAGAPKRVVAPHPPGPPVPAVQDDASAASDVEGQEPVGEPLALEAFGSTPSSQPASQDDERDDLRSEPGSDEGPVHRPLIRASLPRPEGQQPPARPIPEFTIRQPGGGRPNRFRPRHHRGQGGQGHQGHQFHGGHGNRSNGNFGGPGRNTKPNAGRPGMKRHGPHGRKRSK